MNSNINFSIILLILFLILFLIIYFLYINNNSIEKFQVTTSSSPIPDCKQWHEFELDNLRSEFDDLKQTSVDIEEEDPTSSTNVKYEFRWGKSTFGKMGGGEKNPFKNYNKTCKLPDDLKHDSNGDEVCLDHFIEYLQTNITDDVNKIINEWDLRPKHKWKSLLEKIRRYNVFKEWCDVNKNNCDIYCNNCDDSNQKNECIKNYNDNNTQRCKSDTQYYKPEIDSTSSPTTPTHQFTKYETNDWFKTLCDNGLVDGKTQGKAFVKHCNSACDCGGNPLVEDFCRKKNPSLCYYSGAHKNSVNKIVPSPYINLPPDYIRKCNISEKTQCNKEINLGDYYKCLLTQNLKKCDSKCNCTPDTDAALDFDIDHILPTKLQLIDTVSKIITNDPNMSVKKKIHVAMINTWTGSLQTLYYILPKVTDRTKEAILKNMKTNFKRNVSDKCVLFPSGQFINPSELYFKSN